MTRVRFPSPAPPLLCVNFIENKMTEPLKFDSSDNGSESSRIYVQKKVSELFYEYGILSKDENPNKADEKTIKMVSTIGKLAMIINRKDKTEQELDAEVIAIFDKVTSENGFVKKTE